MTAKRSIPILDAGNEARLPGSCSGLRARGAGSFLAGRFEAIEREFFDDGWRDEDDPPPPLATTVTIERARSILSSNSSPDLPFDSSLNPYRGCEHGCIYCYARRTHSYLELSPGLDFESKLFAKTNAAELLRAELSRPGYRAQPISIGANTDAYQPIERERRITRSVIEVLSECRHPFTVVTKSALIERDLDLIAPMAKHNLVKIFVSVTSLDRSLSRRMEPRAAAPLRRLRTIRTLAQAGVPVGVMAAPVIPALNDAALEDIIAAGAEAGATMAGYQMLRLPDEIRILFREWLTRHFPARAEHVMSVVQQLRGGRDNDPRFGTRMTGEGNYASLVATRFRLACRRHGIDHAERGNRPRRQLDCSLFVPPNRDSLAASRQGTLFD